jgi:murein DD-endopeptidase MepM/ murein hydrolase activator NlpD
MKHHRSSLSPHWLPCRDPLLRAARPAAIALALACAGLGACSPATPTPVPTVTPTPTATPSPTTTPTATATATPTFPHDAFPTVTGLNLRAGPDPLHPVVGLARAGTPLAVTGRDHDGGWLAVASMAGQSGWVNARLVQLRRAYDTIPTAPTPSPPPPPTATAAPMDPALPVVLAPPAVAQGDPVLVRLRSAGARNVLALLAGQSADLLPAGPDTWAGLLAVPVQLPPGSHEVATTVIDQNGEPSAGSVTLQVAPGRYREETIVLDASLRSLVDSPERRAENERLGQLWSAVTPERLWSGRWTRPVSGTVSSGFGTARAYAGTQTNTFHTGVDFRGAPGTPVRAAAAGRVALAEALAARGNTVWLDHGWGVYSGYFHMSDLAVVSGDTVSAGQTLGHVGATGMVTGPHLHWEVRLRGVPVGPMQWLLQDFSVTP